MAVTPDNLQVLAYLEKNIGETDDIAAYYDEGERHSIDIARVEDSPQDDVDTYFTLALSDADTGLEADGKSLGVEIVMSGERKFDKLPNIVSTCAFNIMKDEFEIAPDVVFRDVVAMYYPEAAMKHVMFVDPFTWELKSQKLPGKTVAFLQALAISDAEMALVDAEGPDALHDIFETRDVDVFDVSRASMV